jgi:hypothetical protein
MQSMTPLKTLALTAALFGSLSAHANLVVNGGFETGGDFIENFGFADRMEIAGTPSIITGWTAGNGGGWGYSWWMRKPSFGASEGDRCLSLDGNIGSGSWVEQTLTTVPGTQYRLTFDAASDDNAGPAVTEAYLDGSLLGSLTHGTAFPTGASEYPNLIWEQASFDFTATGTSTVLRLYDATTGWYNSIVDNVSVVAITPIPEPAETGVILGCLLTAALVGQRLRSRARR